MAGVFFKSLTGQNGSVDVPAIGLNVGTIVHWNLTRREETPPELGEWTLRAAFSYINPTAWKEPSLQKRITIALGDPRKGGKQFRLQLSSTARTELEGRSLLIYGVLLQNVDK